MTLPGGGVVQGTIIEVGTVASEAEKRGKRKRRLVGRRQRRIDDPGDARARPARRPASTRRPSASNSSRTCAANVLAVPATALTATAGGGYAVELLEGNRRVALAVTPGMFANGYVQVEGSGLREGQTVIESE